MRTYSHNFVSFMMFLYAAQHNKLQKQIAAKQETLLLRVPSEINTMRGVFYTLNQRGQYVQNTGVGFTPVYSKVDQPPYKWRDA